MLPVTHVLINLSMVSWLTNSCFLLCSPQCSIFPTSMCMYWGFWSWINRGRFKGLQVWENPLALLKIVPPLETSNNMHKTPNTEHKTQNTKHKTQNTKHKTQNIYTKCLLSPFGIVFLWLVDWPTHVFFYAHLNVAYSQPQCACIGVFEVG